MSKKYIGFLDILGFKDLVYNNSHDDLVRKFQSVFCLNVEVSLSGGKFRTVSTKDRDFTVADLNYAKVNSTVISDSVIFWTDDDGMQSFINICISIMKLLVSGVFNGFPMRGSISLGDLSVIQSIYGTVKNNSLQSIVGKGLVEAYILESSQNWVGCVIDNKCISKYQELCETYKNVDDIATLDYLVKSGILCEYNVPFKLNKREEFFVVNWLNGNKTPPSQETIIKSFSMHNKLVSNSGVQEKINNTIEFLNYITENKLINNYQ
jgi:hypothetical protein